MLQWRELALTIILTMKEKKTRFLFGNSSQNVLVSTVGGRLRTQKRSWARRVENTLKKKIKMRNQEKFS
jgi:hypothetical protein